jgi:murein DD-endopeptidase MepM/ murein hydrolase activator NlpD
MIRHDYKPTRKNRLNRASRLLDSKSNIASKIALMVGSACILATIMYWSIDSSPQTQQPSEVADSTQNDFNDTEITQNAVQADINLVSEATTEPAVDIPLPLNYDLHEASVEAPSQSNLDSAKSTSQWEQLIDLPLRFDEEPSPQLQYQSAEHHFQYEVVKRGDNLSEIFNRIGVSAKDLIRLIRSSEQSKPLTNLMPGKKIGYIKDNVGLVKLSYNIDELTTLFAERNKDKPHQFDFAKESKSVEYRQNFASGVIQDNLFSAGYKAGLSDKLIMELAGIFGWDIDFALDIRRGDAFTFVYEDKYVDGELIGTGDILAAEFINQGDRYRAVRYTDSKGNKNYYSPNGFSMRKAFLRAPLNFSYISSSFKPKRFHPVLKRWKAHNGIDYGAPKGTPVYAAGEGRVLKAGYSKYNGNYVFIQHGQKYVTRYLHFSKRAVKTGQKVRQKQIIGYVGSTGLATGPHLHYEFLVNGVHRNPRTVKLPQAKPVAKKEQSRFFEQTKPLIAALEVSARVLLAQNEASSK